MEPSKRRYKAILPVSPSPPPVPTLPKSTEILGGGVSRARQSPPPTSKAASIGNDRVSEFVRNLVLILREPSFQDIISWGEQGDCVVIKKAEDFTKTVLPRVYKHQNFASFVRQLNKYDFHKVKTDDEKSVTFHHPDFRLDRLDALDVIKRKTSVARRFATSEQFLVEPGTIAETSAVPARITDVAALQSQIADITQSQNDMASHIHALDHKYRNVLAEFVGFQRNFAQQDGLMHDLMRHLLRNRLEPPTDPVLALLSPDAISDPSPFVRQRELMDAHDPQRITYTSHRQVNESSWLSGTSREAALAPKTYIEERSDFYDYRKADIPRRIEASPRMGRMSSNNPLLGYLHGKQTDGAGAEFEDDEMVMPTIQSNLSAESSSNNSVPIESVNPAPLSFSEHAFSSDDSSPWPNENTYGELQTYTLGHQENLTTSLSFGATISPSLSNAGSSTTSHNLQVPQSTFVPSWSVPPHVLLVDDDAVVRKLSTQFLEVLGCTFDVATDGATAVSIMHSQKYDLVLMDIVMPRMDGLTAISLIRQFDRTTPIISMTSESKPPEVMSYYSSGMNDVLVKPFNEEGLLAILEKHLNGRREGVANALIPRQLERDTTSLDIVVDPPYRDSLETDAPWLADFGPADKRMMEDESFNGLRKRAKLDM